MLVELRANVTFLIKIHVYSMKFFFGQNINALITILTFFYPIMMVSSLFYIIMIVNSLIVHIVIDISLLL